MHRLRHCLEALNPRAWLVGWLLGLVGAAGLAEAQVRHSPPSTPLTEALWPQVEVMTEPWAGWDPEVAHQRLARAHMALPHEEHSPSGWVPQPWWARLRIDALACCERPVLVFPSATQDDVQMWVRPTDAPTAPWLHLPRADQPAGGGTGALTPYWRWPPDLKGTVTVLVRVEGYNRVRFPLQRFDESTHDQRQQQGIAWAVLCLTLPLAMGGLSLAQGYRHWPVTLRLMFFMAVMEWLAMWWVSGLGAWLWPAVDRSTWGHWGQGAYWGLAVLGLLHAHGVLRPVVSRAVSLTLRGGLLVWVVWVPLLAWQWPWTLRFALVWLGGLQALSLWALSMGVRQHPRPTELEQLRIIWLIYAASAVVYGLHWALHWSVSVTLWANVIQGSLLSGALAYFVWQGAAHAQQRDRWRWEQLRERQLWLAVMQHDLWQPLQSLRLGLSTLLSRQSGPPDPVLQSMLQASDALDDFARVETQDALDQPQPIIDLQLLLRQLTAEHRPWANRLSVSLRVHAPRVQVRAHEAAVRRVVRNLLSNALRHTPMGGSILLAIRIQKGQAWLWCFDSGVGMDETRTADSTPRRDWDPLDERFAQGQRQRLGLGLFGVRARVQAQAWQWQVKSEWRKGTGVGIGLGPALGRAPPSAAEREP